MKFLEPWGGQRLSFLLEKAASREAKMWRIYVPKKPSSQVRVPPFVKSYISMTKYISALRKDGSGAVVWGSDSTFE